MRIAVFVARLTLGGLETHIATFIQELLRQGHLVLLNAEFISREVRAQLPLESESFRIIYVNDELPAGVREFQPDLIHAHPFISLVRGYETAAALARPLVVSMHGLYDFGAAQFLEAKISEKAGAIIAVDDGVAAYLRRFLSYPEKIIVIRNGIDLAYFQPPPPGKKARKKHWPHPEWFTITCVSRFENGKEAPLIQLIRIAPGLAKRLGGLNINLVGDGLHYQSIAGQSAEVTQQDPPYLQIILRGRQSDVRDYLAQADLVIACDRAALEGLACQRLVLAANAEGYAGVIHHHNRRAILMERAGYLPRSDWDLEEIILEIARNIDRYSKYPEANYRWIQENFNIKTIVGQLVEVYQKASG